MQRTRLNVPSRLSMVADGQDGYFTRAQAHQAGVRDFQLERAVSYGQIVRVDLGVYRVVGAGVDPHGTLRAAWLRLTPDVSPRERTYRPKVWVARRSAAVVHGFGDFIADIPEFIATRRLQPRFSVSVVVRSAGLDRTDWTVEDGFAVTSVPRTFVDLVAANVDGGHIGRFASNALQAGVVSIEQLHEAAGVDVEAFLKMASK